MIDGLNLALKSFKWENAFNGKDTNSKVKLFNQTLLNHCYLRHKRNNEDFTKVEHLRNEIDKLKSKSKKEYYQNINRNLNDPLA